MYKKIAETPIEGKIMACHLCAFSEDEQSQCKTLFPHITETSVIIYSSNDNGTTILGYYTIDLKDIVESKFYEALIQNTESYEGKPVINGFVNKPCFHISQWEFDESLKSKNKLSSIFTILMASLPLERDSFIWLDEKEPIYYPLIKADIRFGHNKAISYFVDRFLTM